MSSPQPRPLAVCQRCLYYGHSLTYCNTTKRRDGVALEDISVATYTVPLKIRNCLGLGVDVLEEPSMMAKKVGQIPSGTRVESYGTRGEWIKVIILVKGKRHPKVRGYVRVRSAATGEEFLSLAR